MADEVMEGSREKKKLYKRKEVEEKFREFFEQLKSKNAYALFQGQADTDKVVSTAIAYKGIENYIGRAAARSISIIYDPLCRFGYFDSDLKAKALAHDCIIFQDEHPELSEWENLVKGGKSFAIIDHHPWTAEMKEKAFELNEDSSHKYFLINSSMIDQHNSMYDKRDECTTDLTYDLISSLFEPEVITRGMPGLRMAALIGMTGDLKDETNSYTFKTLKEMERKLIDFAHPLSERLTGLQHLSARINSGHIVDWGEGGERAVYAVCELIDTGDFIAFNEASEYDKRFHYAGRLKANQDEWRQVRSKIERSIRFRSEQLGGLRYRFILPDEFVSIWISDPRYGNLKIQKKLARYRCQPTLAALCYERFKKQKIDAGLAILCDDQTNLIQASIRSENIDCNVVMRNLAAELKREFKAKVRGGGHFEAAGLYVLTDNMVSLYSKIPLLTSEIIERVKGKPL